MNTEILFIFQGIDFALCWTVGLILAFFIILVYDCVYKTKKQIDQKMEKERKIFLAAEKSLDACDESSLQAENAFADAPNPSEPAEHSEKTEVSDKKEVLIKSKPEVNLRNKKSQILPKPQKLSKTELKRLAKLERKKANKLKKEQIAQKNAEQRQKVELEKAIFNANDALFLEKIKQISSEDRLAIQRKLIEQVQTCLENSKLSTKRFDILMQKLVEFKNASADYCFALEAEDKEVIQSREDYMLLCLKWLYDCYKKTQNSI